MGAVATFSFSAWQSAYPEFSTTVITSAQAQNYFNIATIYFRNDGGGPVQDPTMQLTLLNMLTAHVAFLAVGNNNGPSSASQGIVGRISSATQGSVSVSAELSNVPQAAAYYAQSEYGWTFWNATAPFRTMNYRSSVGRRFPW
jgi:hypothetical protein